MQADVTTLDAKKAGTVELSDDVFGLQPRPDILHRMVRYQLAKRRAGAELQRGVAVLLRHAVADNLAAVKPQHRHWDVLPGVGEDPRHAEFLCDDT